ncbi:MAG: ADP-ribosylglycohydrolase family protein [Nitrospinota bacterium]
MQKRALFLFFIIFIIYLDTGVVFATPKNKKKTEQIIENKIYGFLIGSAIGDALGGPDEKFAMNYEELLNTFLIKAYSKNKRFVIEDFKDYYNNPAMHSVFEKNAKKGTYTDDTRLKLLVAYAIAESDGHFTTKKLAQAFIDRHKKAKPGGLEHQWLDEYALASRIAAEGCKPDAGRCTNSTLNRLWGGLIGCVGLMSITPMAILHIGDIKGAYLDGYEKDYFDIGYAKDLTALAVSIMSLALSPDYSLEDEDKENFEPFSEVLNYDPYNYSKAQMFGRFAINYIRGRAYPLANSNRNKGLPSLYKDFYKSLSRDFVCDPLEILSVALGIICYTRGDTVESILIAVNY